MEGSTTVEALWAKALELSEDGSVHEAVLTFEQAAQLLDELIAEGYVLRVCKDVKPGRADSDPCLFRGKDRWEGKQACQPQGTIPYP